MLAVRYLLVEKLKLSEKKMLFFLWLDLVSNYITLHDKIYHKNKVGYVGSMQEEILIYIVILSKDNSSIFELLCGIKLANQALCVSFPSTLQSFHLGFLNSECAYLVTAV